MTTQVTPRARVLDSKANRKAVLDALSEGMPFASAANIVGLTRKGLHDYRRDHPEFNAECLRVVAEHERSLVRRLTEASAEDAKHAAWLLERRHPDRWSTRSEVRMFTSDDADERDDVEGMSDDALEKIARGE